MTYCIRRWCGKSGQRKISISQERIYYHRASFSNFSTTASILEILPYLELWYFFIVISELDMNLVVFIMCCAEQCFQIVWLCNILDVAGLPDHLDILNFCIISKHTKINHNPRFGRFWEDLHENKKMFVLACQSVTSWDALLKSAATRRLLIASTRLLSRWVSIRHPCRGVILCDIIWKARVKIIDGLLQSAMDRFIWPKKWNVYLIHI